MKQKQHTLTLKEIDPGRKCILKNIRGTGSTYQRLLEMGLTEETELNVIRYAPMGDPIEIELHGYNLSLRKSEAEMVEVQYA